MGVAGVLLVGRAVGRTLVKGSYIDSGEERVSIAGVKVTFRLTASAFIAIIAGIHLRCAVCLTRTRVKKRTARAAQLRTATLAIYSM